MEFNLAYVIERDAPLLWMRLMDVHQVAGCLEGVEELAVLGPEDYSGVMRVKMGPVKLRFAGKVTVLERDHDNLVGRLQAEARDAKAGGGFRASLTMRLAPQSATRTGLDLLLETTFLGRIGELGRPLIKKKINTMMDDFVRQLETLEQVDG